jgi:uncharacterized membrane protein YdbT with pleckstrin-like domain
MEMEEYKNYKVDIKNTILANIPFIFFGLIVISFLFFVSIFLGKIEDPNTQLIALIVFMFTFIKLVSFIGYPQMHYKLRDKEDLKDEP